MIGYRDIFCILLFICIIHSGGGKTVEFCTADVVGFNQFNTSNTLRSPNYQTKANYNISKDCEINVTVANIVQPYVVNAVQTSLIDCTERFRVLDASKNPFTDQTTNCTGSVGLHNFSVDTYFRSGGRQTLFVQLPAGYAPRVSVTVSVFPVVASTTTAAPTPATVNVTSNTATPTTTAAPTTTTASLTTAAATTAVHPAERTTEHSTKSSDQNEMSRGHSKPDPGSKTTQIAIGVGAGGFLLIVIIIVLACALASRHRNRKRQDEKETIQLATNVTDGFDLMADERQSGVEQVDGSVDAASMAIPDYEYHSVEVDPTVHGQQSTGNVQERLSTTADRPHIEEEYATISKPFKQVELNDSRQSGIRLVVQHQTGSAVDDREIYAEAPAVPVYMPGSSGEAGEHDTAEEVKPTKNADDLTDKQVSSENNIVDQSDRVPSQVDKQAASGDLAGGEEVHFVDNELYSTGGGDWVGLQVTYITNRKAKPGCSKATIGICMH